MPLTSCAASSSSGPPTTRRPPRIHRPDRQLAEDDVPAGPGGSRDGGDLAQVLPRCSRQRVATSYRSPMSGSRGRARRRRAIPPGRRPRSVSAAGPGRAGRAPREVTRVHVPPVSCLQIAGYPSALPTASRWPCAEAMALTSSRGAPGSGNWPGYPANEVTASVGRAASRLPDGRWAAMCRPSAAEWRWPRQERRPLSLPALRG